MRRNFVSNFLAKSRDSQPYPQVDSFVGLKPHALLAVGGCLDRSQQQPADSSMWRLFDGTVMRTGPWFGLGTGLAHKLFVLSVF